MHSLDHHRQALDYHQKTLRAQHTCAIPDSHPTAANLPRRPEITTTYQHHTHYLRIHFHYTLSILLLLPLRCPNEVNLRQSRGINLRQYPTRVPQDKPRLCIPSKRAPSLHHPRPRSIPPTHIFTLRQRHHHRLHTPLRRRASTRASYPCTAVRGRAAWGSIVHRATKVRLWMMRLFGRG